MRCSWAEGEEMRTYHDEEWGVPQHDDAKLFELLSLEGAQAGLSWLTILKRRGGYRKAFEGFDLNKVSVFNDSKVSKLMDDPSIIRNKLKIMSVIKNAKATLQLQAEFGSFNNYLWKFV